MLFDPHTGCPCTAEGEQMVADSWLDETVNSTAAVRVPYQTVRTTTRLQKKSQIFCDVILSNMLLGANDPQKFHFWVPHPK